MEIFHCFILPQDPLFVNALFAGIRMNTKEQQHIYHGSQMVRENLPLPIATWNSKDLPQIYATIPIFGMLVSERSEGAVLWMKIPRQWKEDVSVSLQNKSYYIISK